MAREHDSNSALAKAVRQVGSQSAFGRLVGRAQSLVNDWLRKGKPLPAELVLTVESATGISRHELRPDIYPPPESSPARDPLGQPPVSSPSNRAGGSPSVPAAHPGGSGSGTDPALAGVPSCTPPLASAPVMACAPAARCFNRVLLLQAAPPAFPLRFSHPPLSRPPPGTCLITAPVADTSGRAAWAGHP